ncbi:hypothetical protein C5U62_31800 [Pseudomonas protegens]|uniref:DUF1983 domain-containing protein n=1 Tax=Pseudomonas protegens TaxID=380021 RepID=A0A2T6GB92_9PSED|nr:hypothetical protein [Pseudomonas protegens]PUA41422.1 hypothetical protein C5U62_31800 [Pseudomonas protegens]
MQSSNFVEGVSGWRIADGRIELYGGPVPLILGKTPEPGKPSVVVDGVTYISEAFIKDGSITKTAVGGKPYLAGFGAGVELPFIVADRFAINGRDTSETLDMIAGKIRETELGVGLKGAIADQVREVIRAECKPGGILYRLR